jgi:hypothetical protein
VTYPDTAKSRPSHIVVFGKDTRRDPLLVDLATARILELSDGTRTARDIVAQLDQELESVEVPDLIAWIEHLFLSGLVSLTDVDNGA